MEIDVAAGPPQGATLVVTVADPPGSLPAGAEGIDELLSSHEASTERGTARLVSRDGRRIVAVGIGPRDQLEPDALPDAAAPAARELKATVGGSPACPLHPPPPRPAAQEGPTR